MDFLGIEERTFHSRAEKRKVVTVEVELPERHPGQVRDERDSGSPKAR